MFVNHYQSGNGIVVRSHTAVLPEHGQQNDALLMRRVDKYLGMLQISDKKKAEILMNVADHLKTIPDNQIDPSSRCATAFYCVQNSLASMQHGDEFEYRLQLALGRDTYTGGIAPSKWVKYNQPRITRRSMSSSPIDRSLSGFFARKKNFVMTFLAGVFSHARTIIHPQSTI